MTRIVLVNGPARSGKDCVGGIVSKLTGAQTMKFAHALKVATHALFLGLHGREALLDSVAGRGSSDCYWRDDGAMFNDAHYESRKDLPLPRFFGATPRESYIAVSELLLKPLFGKAFFGDILTTRIEQSSADVVVITDSGFTEEVAPIVDRYGQENISLITLSRPGTAFDENDSRGYIWVPDGVARFHIRNEDGLDGLAACVSLALQSFGFDV